MNTVVARVERLFDRPRNGVLLVVISLIAVLLIASQQSGLLFPSSVSSTDTTETVSFPTLNATLSQTRFVQNESATAYMRVEVKIPPAKINNVPKLPVDFIVVLDRSGSMAEANKLPFAKQAITKLLSTLSGEDRFALVTFDSTARLDVPLTLVAQANQEAIATQVNALVPGSSTNIQAGLELAHSLLNSVDNARSRRVLLLSDGIANAGKTSTQDLSEVVQSVASTKAVISTIGLGLGFNELMLSSLAEAGMGNYSFLENVQSLDAILKQSFAEGQNLYAEASELQLKLNPQVQLADTGAYAINSFYSPSSVTLRTGQLIGDRTKIINLTLRVPSHQLGKLSLGSADFILTKNGEPMTIPLSAESFTIEVVPAAQRATAIQSVDRQLLDSMWTTNNVGRLQRDLNDALSRGDKAAASKQLELFKADADRAYGAGGMTAPAPLRESLSQIESKVGSSFTGTAADQAVKQNRLKKELHEQGILLQKEK